MEIFFIANTLNYFGTKLPSEIITLILHYCRDKIKLYTTLIYKNSIKCLVLTDNYLIIGSGITITILNCRNRFKLIKTLTEHKSLIVDIVATDKYIISLSDDKKIKIWDIHTLKCIKTFNDHNCFLNKLVVSKNKDYLIASCNENSYKVYIWDLLNLKYINNFHVDGFSLWSLAMIDNNVIIVGACNIIEVWKINSNNGIEYIKTIQIGAAADVLQINYWNDHIFLRLSPNLIKIYNTEFKLIRTLNVQSNYIISDVISNFEIVPHKYLFSVSPNKKIKILDDKYTCTDFIENVIHSDSTILALSNDFLICGFESGMIKIWSYKL